MHSIWWLSRRVRRLPIWMACVSCLPRRMSMLHQQITMHAPIQLHYHQRSVLTSWFFSLIFIAAGPSCCSLKLKMWFGKIFHFKKVFDLNFCFKEPFSSCSPVHLSFAWLCAPVNASINVPASIYVPHLSGVFRMHPLSHWRNGIFDGCKSYQIWQLLLIRHGPVPGKPVACGPNVWTAPAVIVWRLQAL